MRAVPVGPSEELLMMGLWGHKTCDGCPDMDLRMVEAGMAGGRRRAAGVVRTRGVVDAWELSWRRTQQ
eukprot:8538329-Pyramimonas_sp.AAC.1